MPKGKRGGPQPGSGRPKGKKSASTLEREKVFAEYRQKILRSADILYQAQMSLARGQQFLYVIVSRQEGKKTVKEKPRLIEDQATIEAYLSGELDDAENEYYFITSKEPNNYAIDSAMNRVFGKPIEHIDHTTNGKDLPIPILGGTPPDKK